ncbi:MAG: hypothetical protein IJZ89_03690 [Clostridia bacterium]|nr:hypothetical protein [Clostridia bacterium]
MKKLIITLAVFLITAVMLIPSVFAEEFNSTVGYPTKITYDEATKTMTISYVGSGGWYELMPISDADENGTRNYDMQNFIDNTAPRSSTLRSANTVRYSSLK